MILGESAGTAAGRSCAGTWKRAGRRRPSRPAARARPAVDRCRGPSFGPAPRHRPHACRPTGPQAPELFFCRHPGGTGAVAPVRSAGCRPGFHRIWTQTRRNTFPGTESGQTRTHMVPLLSVINHGAAKTHRKRCRGSSPIPAPRRTATQPDSSMPISTGSPAARRPASWPAATASSATRAGTGSMDASRRATPSTNAAVTPPSTCATRRRPRSRRDGLRGVQSTSTQARLKTSVPFVPPKPNEFFNATSMRICRAVFAQ